jgi:hypothetical protein
MNIVQLLEDSRNTLLAYNGGHFKDVGLYTHMKASKEAALPSVWFSPFKVVPEVSGYTGSANQKKTNFFTFNIACKLEDLDACQKALSAIYTGYEYVDNDDLNRNNPYSPMEHVGGELTDTHGTIVHWSEVYSTFKVGG